MRPEKFLQLNKNEQAEFVWEGIFIGDSQDQYHNILLYKIDELFVEVYYHRKSNAIEKFVAYAETELMNSHLSKN